MPPRRAPLPEGIEQNNATKQVRCLLCYEFDPFGAGRWMAPKSLKNHLKSTKHDSNRIRNDTQVQQQAIQNQKLANTYQDGTVTFETPATDVHLNSRTRMFTEDEDTRMADDLADDSWMQQPLIPISIPEHLSFDPEEERNCLHQQYIMMLEEAILGSEDNNFDESDETTAFLADEFRAVDLEPSSDEEDIANYFNGTSTSKDWSPYPNKTMALLDILDNLPRLRLSTSHMQMILWLLREVGAADVSSYQALRKLQAGLREQCGSSPKAYKSGLGNHFYVNDVRDSIARDFSNPEVAKHLQFYPEETGGTVSEVWQAEHRVRIATRTSVDDALTGQRR
ncbi:uncharacterized protein EV420DRAFT_1636071 [Desarmillaria tabescens]|uniref:Uncharacterized protein n=1 Tax=Armillaria tabescens TaxID=1929756 RepID=A0AA39T642_ARMTA|nr:uncharacterized protein EV420DRAFT_1636071 [Desarmillaria tabescens]KAK0467036.1 hypothetical protein EV420DRAFT_1636071 [Desarmillaria tabescens]